MSYPPSPSLANSAPPTIRLLAFQIKSMLGPQHWGYSSGAYHPSHRREPSDQETGNRPSKPTRCGIGPIIVHPIFPEASATKKFRSGIPEIFAIAKASSAVLAVSSSSRFKLIVPL